MSEMESATPKSAKKSASKKATKEKNVSFFKKESEESVNPEVQDVTVAQQIEKLAHQLSALEKKIDGFIEEYRENQNKAFQNRPQHSGPRPFRPEGRPFRPEGGRPFRSEGRPFRPDGGRPYNNGPRRPYGQGNFGNRPQGGGGNYRPGGPRRPFNSYENRGNSGGDFRGGAPQRERHFPPQQQQD